MITIGVVCLTVGVIVVLIKSDLSLMESSWQTMNSTATRPNKSAGEHDFGRDSIQGDPCGERVAVPHDKFIFHTEKNNCTDNGKNEVNEKTISSNENDDHPCNLYGLLWLGNNTCYRTIESIEARDWYISMHNKTSAVEVCQGNNATLPYSEYNIEKLCSQILFSAFEHIELIYKKNLMRPDIGIWFGVTFDEYLGKYKVDITGELFDIDRYWLRAKVSETKQVSTHNRLHRCW